MTRLRKLVLKLVVGLLFGFFSSTVSYSWRELKGNSFCPLITKAFAVIKPLNYFLFLFLMTFNNLSFKSK